MSKVRLHQSEDNDFPTGTQSNLFVDEADGHIKHRKSSGELVDLEESGGGAVESVFGRAGVVAAAASDYDASQVDNDSGVAGATVGDALDTLDTLITDATDGSNIYSETLVVANWVLDVGTTYYQDVTHSLGTLDIIKSFRTTSDDTDVIMESATALDANTTRVKIEGNTTEIRLVFTSGVLGATAPSQIIFTTLSTDTTLNTTTHRYIKVDTSGGDVTLTLPLSTDGIYPYDIWKTTSDTNNVIVVRSGSDTISGDTSAFWSAPYNHFEFIPDNGTQWLIK